MKIFLTGASGYAGYHAGLRLAAAGHTVTGVVRHPEQSRLQFLRMREIKLIGAVRKSGAGRAKCKPIKGSSTRS